MSKNLDDSSDGTIEQCIDEIDGLVEQLERFPLPVLAFALRTH